jgi:hypothetical protein
MKRPLRLIQCLLLLIVPTELSGQTVANLQLNFTASAESFQPATDEYRAIWSAEGPRIVVAMESVTGLRFEPGPIDVNVYEGTSLSGVRGRTPMRLRGSYSSATKRATLVHELAHRLIGDLVPGTFDDHPVIFLFVYDVWVELWGQQFADEQVTIERKRVGPANYDGIWMATLALTRTERTERFKAFLVERRK